MSIVDDKGSIARFRKLGKGMKRGEERQVGEGSDSQARSNTKLGCKVLRRHLSQGHASNEFSNGCAEVAVFSRNTFTWDLGGIRKLRDKGGSDSNNGHVRSHRDVSGSLGWVTTHI